MTKKQNDTGIMTSGNVLAHIFRFMLPLLIGNLFQQFYTIVDSMVVGRFVSSTALGAVGAVSNIVALFLALCAGLGGGISVLVA